MTVRFPIRAITAGVTLGSLADLEPVARALEFLAAARDEYAALGYPVQTVRVALGRLHASSRATALATPPGPDLVALDQLAVSADALVGLGPIDPRLLASPGRWAVDVVTGTERVYFSIETVSGGALDEPALGAAAGVIAALAAHTPGGEGNFRFAAACRCPAGTPFFPVAWHEGRPAFAIATQSAGVVSDVVAAEPDSRDHWSQALDEAFAPVANVARRLAASHAWAFRGIDVSPAPLGDDSIARAIEHVSGVKFGGHGTLAACAAVTQALRQTRVERCGYSGLMLPVLEDRLLAARAGEGRYGLGDLLMYSAVCGTGLDVVPLPGATPVATIEAILRDVAALSLRLEKPLSARLLPIPGRAAGEMASFENPHLSDCAVLKTEGSTE